MNEREAMAVLAEPSRFRIVELLSVAPRTVGEVAASLGALQPQTTKHLQALANVELITVHRLGRRRVAALRRDTLRQLAAWIDALAVSHPSERALDEYSEAIEGEEARFAADASGKRTIRISRTMTASAEQVWRAWTTTKLVRRWWAPEHFSVARCVVQPTAGGALRIVLREPDGAEYTATGTFLDVRPYSELRFELSPLGPDGAPLFAATHAVTFTENSGHTTVQMTIVITELKPQGIAALAGVQLGWRQTLDRLAVMLTPDGTTRT